MDEAKIVHIVVFVIGAIFSYLLAVSDDLNGIKKPVFWRFHIFSSSFITWNYVMFNIFGLFPLGQ